MPKRVSEKEIFKTKFFTIKDIEIEFSSGKRSIYQILEKADTSLIVPLDNENNIIFIKEYFYATDKFMLGLPKGRIDPSENETETANRELQEEIGMKTKSLEKIVILSMSPGYLTQKTHVFLARDLSESSLRGDEEEKIEIVKYPFEKFDDLIEKQELTEARMIAALYLVQKYLAVDQ